MKKLITIIIPAYNEEKSLSILHKNICETIEKIKDYEWEILYVNDGSNDKTQQIIQNIYDNDFRVSFIELSRNFGKENAMLAGFDNAHGDCAIIMDADLQHPPYVIKDMIIQWENGFEDIYAERKNRGKESFLRHKLSILYYRILQKTTSIDVLPNVGDFRLLDKKCIESIKKLRETQRYTKGLFCWIGFKKHKILFSQGDRFDGKSSFNYITLFNLAIEGITSYTTIPLRFATVLGFITGLGAIIYLIWTLIKVIIWGDPVAGFPTLICVILFLGSVQLICIGILGEYIARIFNESKHRPNYIITNCKFKKSI